MSFRLRDTKLSRLRQPWSYALLICIITSAVVIHLPVLGNPLNPDTTTYMEQTKTLATAGSLEITSTPYPRHPPIMAVVFLPFALALGYNEFAVHVMQLLFLVVDLIVLYAISIPLGPKFGLLPSILLSVEPVFYLNMSEGRSLSVLVLFALVTVWGIWKGLENGRMLPFAALGASLGYLTADTVGYLFVVAAIVGFLWRFHYLRWRVFRDRGYLLAAIIFLSTVSLWISYNLLITGSPYTDVRVVGYLDRLVGGTPANIAIVTGGGMAVYFTLFVSQSALPFLVFGEGRAAAKRLLQLAVSNQRVGALVLFIVVTIGISSIVSAAFLLFEPFRSLLTADTYLRYVAVVAPLTFTMVAMHSRAVEQKGRRIQWIVPVAISVLILSSQMVAKIAQGQNNSTAFTEIREMLRAKGVLIAYSDVRPFLQYNLPEFHFVSIFKGVSTQLVNITLSDVPLNATLLTVIYVPKSYDQRIGGFYFIEHFDPAAHSPFTNSYFAP